MPVGGGATTATHLATRGPVGRLAVLAVLLLATGLTFRGRIPVPHAAPRDAAGDNPASTVGVIALLSVSMLVMAVAVLTRRAGPPKPAPRELPDSPGGSGRRRNLRWGLIALGVLIASLLAMVVLHHLGVGSDSQRITVPPGVPDRVGGGSPRPSPAAKSGDTSRLLIATTAALVVMTVVATVLSAVRTPREKPVRVTGGATPVAPSGPEPLVVAAELGLAEVANRDVAPREAIIACYAAMERALAGAPTTAPQAADTPSEVLARAVGTGAVGRGNASELVALFTEARFSTHAMAEHHRQSAEAALRSVLGELGRFAGAGGTP